MTELAKWDSFYVIVGSAAGALIGLQFVVMTLVAVRPTAPSAEAGAAFSTPTIVHFGTVLLLAALLRAPWETTAPPAILCAIIGFLGVIYAILTARLMRRQTIYKPVFEDWFFHSVLPMLSYATLAASPFAATDFPREALFGVGASTLLLLFTGIHNAWDAVAYHVFDQDKKG